MSELPTPEEPMTPVPPENTGTRPTEELKGGVEELQTRLVATGVELITAKVSAGLTMLPCVAVICELPTTTPVPKPVVAPIVATDMVADAHVTLVVMFCVLLSL